MIFSIIASIVIALLRGGSLRPLGRFPLRHAYLVLVGLALQLALFPLWGSTPLQPWRNYLYPASLIPLLLVVVLNYDRPGIKTLGLGLFLNFLVIAANGGYMPASLEALRGARLFEAAAALGSKGHYMNQLLLTGASKLPFLGDIMVLGYPLPQPAIFSPGDILIAVGAFIFLQWAMLGSRWMPAALKEWGERPLARALLLFASGLALGWLFLGWGLWPLQRYYSDPWDLHLGHQETYLTLVADSYGLNGDIQLARKRLAGFEEGEIRDLLSTLIERNETSGDMEASQRLRRLAGDLGLVLPLSSPDK